MPKNLPARREKRTIPCVLQIYLVKGVENYFFSSPPPYPFSLLPSPSFFVFAVLAILTVTAFLSLNAKLTRKTIVVGKLIIVNIYISAILNKPTNTPSRRINKPTNTPRQKINKPTNAPAFTVFNIVSLFLNFMFVFLFHGAQHKMVYIEWKTNVVLS